MTPSQIVNERAQMAFWWCGIGFLICFGVSLMNFMAFIPPPSPMMTGEEIIAKYQDNWLLLRTGIIIALFGCGMYFLFNVMIAIQLKRMEAGRQFPIFAVSSLVAGTINVVFFFIPFVFWSAAFYRLDRNPDLVLLINDMAWLEFVMIAPPGSIQFLCIGFAVLGSTAKKEVLPRWFGFMSIWMAVLGAPGILAIYFFKGPFAWNGLIGFWIPLVAFSIWFFSAFVVLRKAIKNHKDELTEG